MPAADYQRILDGVRDHFDIVPGAEITTEANPETLSPELLAQIRDTGVNRLSMGMQSAVPHVLATLDRVHTPGRVVEAAGWARAAGFTNLSLDLIYGTPGESIADWETSVDSALALEPDHISAYSLIVEDGTPLARRMAKGELPYPDEDDLADKYCLADEKFSSAGLGWYEVSNWAKPGYECRHNLAYWHGDEWWGIGAGAHSFVGGRRWWNHRRPDTYESAVYQGSAVDGIETLTPEQARTESVMLGIRLAEGLDTALLTPSELAKAEQYVSSGHLVRQGDRLVCTLQGRLIADLITREILD
jgi:oxygen-independent coproporphyrinogen-3 oxidase